MVQAGFAQLGRQRGGTSSPVIFLPELPGLSRKTLMPVIISRFYPPRIPEYFSFVVVLN